MKRSSAFGDFAVIALTISIGFLVEAVTCRTPRDSAHSATAANVSGVLGLMWPGTTTSG